MIDTEKYQQLSEEVREKTKDIIRLRFRNANREHPFIESLIRFSFSSLLEELDNDIHAAELPPPPESIEVANVEAFDNTLTADSLLNEKVNLVSLPQLVIELQEAINSPHSNADSLAKIISNDVKLTASLLRLVNSPLYGLDSPIETVSRAVTIIGMRQLTSLAIGATLISNISKRLKQFSLESFWLHSFGCAAIARRLAEAAKLDDPERFFVSGLLHDLGYLFQLGAYPELSTAVTQISLREGMCLCDAERQVFGFTHSEVGGLLLEHWNLSEATSASARWHHDIEDAGDLGMIDHHVIHVADVMAKALGYHAQNDLFVSAVNPASWDALGVGTEVLDGIIEELHLEIDTVAQILLPQRR